MHTEKTIEAFYTQHEMVCGIPEKVFAAADEQPNNVYNEYAAIIENISKPDIVHSQSSFADLILPRKKYFLENALFSFLAINETTPEHRTLLEGLIDAAIQKNGTENNTLLLHILKEKAVPERTDYYAIMSVAYLHIWSVQTDDMKRSDIDFYANGITNSPVSVTENDTQLMKEVIKQISTDISISIADTPRFAPIDIELASSSASVVDLLLAARICVRYMENTPSLQSLVDKGIRLLIRKDEQSSFWTCHLLTGGRLQTISVTD